jgi:hypothetical protein
MFFTALSKICRTAFICFWHNVHQWNFVFLCMFISETTKRIIIKFVIGIYIESCYMDFFLVKCQSNTTSNLKIHVVWDVTSVSTDKLLVNMA